MIQRAVGAVVLLVVAATIGVLPALHDHKAVVSTAGPSPVLSVAPAPAVADVPVAAAPALADAALNGLPGIPSGDTAVAGSTGSTAPIAGTGSAGGRATASGPAVAATVGVARVTGLSFVLDILQVGAGIGMKELYGLVVSGVGTIVPTNQLPPQLVNQAFQVLAVPPKVFDQFVAPTTQGFAAFRSAIAPLAAADPGANALLRAMSQALVLAGTEGKPLVNPLDAQVVQLGQFLLVLQEGG
jgi:hypothetical protein